MGTRKAHEKGDPNLNFIKRHHISLKHLRGQGEGLKGSASLSTTIPARVGRDTRRECAKKVVGGGEPSRLTGQTFACDAEFGYPQSEMAHRRGESTGAALNMNEADTVARVAEGSVRQLPVAVEGFSVEGSEQSKQISHGTLAVLHRFPCP